MSEVTVDLKVWNQGTGCVHVTLRQPSGYVKLLFYVFCDGSSGFCVKTLNFLFISLVWIACYTYQTHMQSFHAAWSERAAIVRMVARNAESTRIRMGTQNSSTPPSTESFQPRTIDTTHESCPGTPVIDTQTWQHLSSILFHRCFSWSYWVRRCRHTTAVGQVQVPMFQGNSDIFTILYHSSINIKITSRFEIFKAMKIPVTVFWVMMLCSVAVGCLCFGGPWCLHLHHPLPLPIG